MTFSINLANVSAAISGISISGITIKDKDEVSASWVSLPNVLYPKPDGWVSDLSIEYDSVLQGLSAPSTVSYNLNYRFLGVQVGDSSIFPVAYSDLIDKLILVINGLVAISGPYSGKVEMQIGNLDIGPKADPAGNNFFGADIQLHIKELQN